jgi:sugar phosphate isomerase/epimerase
MRIGICTGERDVAAAAEAGFAYVEMAAGALMPGDDDATFAPTAARLKALPLPIEAFNCFVPAVHPVTGSSVDRAALGAYMDIVLRRAAAVGAKIMVFGSGAARRAPEGFPLETARAQYVDAIRLAGETAAKYGMTIALEPLNTRQCNFFNRVDEGAGFVRAADHPHVRLLTDLFHFTEAGEPLAHLEEHGPLFAHAHLATPELPETGPGRAYDFTAFLAALRRGGYDGRISVEDNPGLLGGLTPPLTPAFRAIFAYVEGCLASHGAYEGA